LTAEVNAGHLSTCKHALKNFWQPTLDVKSKQFQEKTMEDEDDRTDSVYFKN